MFAELGGGIHVGKRTGHDSRWELHVGRAVFLIKSARKPILGISNVSDDNADLLKRHAIDCQTSLQVGALTRQAEILAYTRGDFCGASSGPEIADVILLRYS